MLAKPPYYSVRIGECQIFCGKREDRGWYVHILRASLQNLLEAGVTTPSKIEHERGVHLLVSYRVPSQPMATPSGKLPDVFCQAALRHEVRVRPAQTRDDLLPPTG